MPQQKIVLSLPIRNWNEQLNEEKQNRVRVLSLPIRNWNFNIDHFLFPDNRRFESTYKELKPRWQACPWAGGLSFESTYKELKQDLWDKTFNDVFGFESTYKELKHTLIKYVSSVELSFESTYKELKHVSTETITGSMTKVLSLPIRNWNTVWRYIWVVSPLRFESTYKELKHSSPADILRSHVGFESTYKELKHSTGEVFSGNKVKFWVYL